MEYLPVDKRMSHSAVVLLWMVSNLKKPINRADIFVRPEIVNFAGRFNNRQTIDKALKQAQADVQYAAAARAFNKGDMEECLEQFFRAIHSRYDIEKPVPRRLIRRKLGIINTLKEQNKNSRTDAGTTGTPTPIRP